MRILQHALDRVDTHVPGHLSTQIEMILIGYARASADLQDMIGCADVPQKEFLEARVARNRIIAQPQPFDRIGELFLKEAHSARRFLP